MFRRSKKKLINENNESDVYAAWIKSQVLECQNPLACLLRPFEHHLYVIQSILLWEYPLNTLYVVLSTNLLFWLATLVRFYHLVGLTGLFALSLHTFVYTIWPEIRGSPSPAEEEKWVVVHPQYFTVDDWSLVISSFWISFKEKVRWLSIFRQLSHIKFTILMIFMFSSLAVVGCHISGIMLIYCFVMSLFILPALSHYSVIKKTDNFIAPYVYKLEGKLNVKRLKKRKNRISNELKMIDSDSDVELNDFVPTQEYPSLSRFNNCLESDVESTGHTPKINTPVTSLSGESTDEDFNDLEDYDEDDMDDNLKSLLPELRKMPGMDDTNLDESYEDTHNNTLLANESIEKENITNDDLSLNEDIFDDSASSELQKSYKKKSVRSSRRRKDTSSDSDINDLDLVGGLDFTDSLDDDNSGNPGMLGRMAGRFVVPVSMISNTFSSVGYGAIFGFNKIGETYQYVRGTNKNVNSNDQINEKSNFEDVKSSNNEMLESSDDIHLEEFEFFDEEDLEI